MEMFIYKDLQLEQRKRNTSIPTGNLCNFSNPFQGLDDYDSCLKQIQIQLSFEKLKKN